MSSPLVKDSDVAPVLLDSQPTLECGLEVAWEPEAHRGLGEAHGVGESCREQVWKACARRQAS